MKTSGLFTAHSQTIPVTYGVPLRIVFFGDVHRDSPAHAETKWQRFLQYARGLKDAWFFGMGDYLDSTSTSERECLGSISSKMHETFATDIEQLQLAKCELIAKELSFMKGRIIGLLNGNHYFEFKNRTNSDQKIAELLGAHYLGVCTLTRLYFSASGRYTARDLFAHHGAGAARLVGGSINRVQQMAEGVEADIYAMGHDHKRAAVPAQPRLFLNSSDKNGLRIEQREPVVLRTGSFLASYQPGHVNYNVDACRPPSSLGHVEVEITLHRKRSNGADVVEVETRTIS